jgi:hypothetical protein
LFDFLIGLAFVVMVVGPAILASMQRAKSHDKDGNSDTGAAEGGGVAAMSASDAGNAAATGTNDAHGSKLDL